MNTKPCAVDLEDFQTAAQSDELSMTIVSAESKRSANMCIVACLRNAIQASDGHNRSGPTTDQDNHMDDEGTAHYVCGHRNFWPEIISQNI